ncbi:oxidoreductase [Thozetella sp. PMI_491]|nr:oxidoreductase [Thozetella sp. PMI_491]
MMAATPSSTPSASVSFTHHAMGLDEAIMARHTTRRFLPTPVSKELLHNALELARHAPSNSNTQPWRLYILTGAALDRLKASLTAAAATDTVMKLVALPAEYQHFRSELGGMVYGQGLGIARDDKKGRRVAEMRNYDFFGAPAAAIVCMDRGLTTVDVVGVGMYLQSFLLALTEEGVSSGVEVSVANYPEAIRGSMDIPEQMDILCGVAIGYEDPAEKVNYIRAIKQEVEGTTIMLED